MHIEYFTTLTSYFPSMAPALHFRRNVSKDHLFEIFGTYGQVKSASLHTLETPQNRGRGRIPQAQRGRREEIRYGAVLVFDEEECAKKALMYMNGGRLDGKVLKVSFGSEFKKFKETVDVPSREKVLAGEICVIFTCSHFLFVLILILLWNRSCATRGRQKYYGRQISWKACGRCARPGESSGYSSQK